MGNTTVRWNKIQTLTAREGATTYWRPYGIPAVMSSGNSVISGAPQMPRWRDTGKVAISVAVNGAFYTKAENPNQAQTPEEIIASGKECIDAGAQILHVHVRDEKGYSALDFGLFAEVLSELRAYKPGVALDACLVAVNDEEVKHMVKVIEQGLVRSVPVNTTALILGDNLFVKPPHTILEKTRQILALGATPQLAVYTDGDIDNARRLLIDSGVVRGSLPWLLVAGLPGCVPMYSPQSMIHGLMRQVDLIRHVDPHAQIIVCAGGRASLHLATLGLLMGLHVRVGMEDTVWKWPHRDDMIERNVDAFQMIRTVAENLGRELMTSAEFIEICARSGQGSANLAAA